MVDTPEPGSDAGQEQPRPAEDVSDYVRRLRSLPVQQVVADVMFSLLNTAQAKLGRRDARLLIDLAAVTVEHARPYLSGELTQQIDQVLGQLRLAQVSAEGHPGAPGKPEENDLDRVPAPPPAGAAQPAEGGPAGK